MHVRCLDDFICVLAVYGGMKKTCTCLWVLDKCFHMLICLCAYYDNDKQMGGILVCYTVQT